MSASVIAPQRESLIRAVQNYCADILQSGRELAIDDGLIVAGILNHDDDPRELFRLLDERTGDWRIGYRTSDGREWFPILRRLRNTVGSGLLENLR